jgi:UV DNA damage endonuclease
MRLSSEMFPFASHEVYGYKLAPFASEVLAEAGKVIAQLGHRVSVHPGQFTQFGSPRKEVIESSIRDLEYHDELLSLLKLPPQQDRDAVMILHMGGTYGSKEETLDRFRTNYARLSDSIKRRMVLENDDMSWSVHDLLPICEELNIPMVLDFHHHNIIFDSTQLREGTLDIIELYPRIRATWNRKNITQKMHYSEPTATAITPMQRRKHSPRVKTLPPCVPDMDLMIEAKDKEQAVFELMKKFNLPGHELINDLIPHVRTDENVVKAKKSKKDEEHEQVLEQVPEQEVGMGGEERRVYWPPGMEEWLRPKKRERPVKITEDTKGDDIEPKTPVKKVPRVTKTGSVKKRAVKKAVVPTPSETESDMDVDKTLPPKRRSTRGGHVSYKEDHSE